MIRSAAIALLLANAALANEPAATDVEVQELPPPAPEAAIALPMARLDTRAFIVADKRIELSAQWTSD